MTSRGWNWIGTGWVYRRMPTDIWSPWHEQAEHDAVHEKHQSMMVTRDGQAMDAWVEHFTACDNGCADIETPQCADGRALFGALAFKWKVWCEQYMSAQRLGQPMKMMYRG